MLYVFLVDTGSMLTFDMSLALGTVSALKEAIHVKTKIPEDKQVLLINGGEALSSASRVCAHSAAGTDTSPIFVFDKSAIETNHPPVPLTDYGPDPDLKERVDSCLNMESTYNTVVARTELAKQIYEMSTQQVRVCDKLVHDQHLQHQGWQAVTANLDDVVSAFRGSWYQLENNIKQFLQQKSSNEELLRTFHETLEVLNKLPLIPELLHSSMTTSNKEKLIANNSQLTLFDWINQKDHQKNLSEVADICLQALNRFDPSFLDELKKETEDLLINSNNLEMKEIKGLGDRLYGLDELMSEARKLSNEQNELSNSLYRNQQRFSNYQDKTLLPDLCKSHRMSLEVMMKNHQQLRDIRRRCVQAKKELSVNLHARLKWIVFIEKRVAEIDEKILVHRENIRRLRLHLEIVQQIHLAPRLYVFAIREVVRRRKFSKSFQEWASNISGDSSSIYKDETRRRKDVMTLINNHFLATLFPGISDFLPAFALDPPSGFDSNLPQVEEGHLQLLKERIPRLLEQVEAEDDIPDHAGILSKYFSEKSPATNRNTNRVNEFLYEINGEIFINQSHFTKKIHQLVHDVRCLREMFKLLHQTSHAITSDTNHHIKEVTQHLTEGVSRKMSDNKSRNDQLTKNLDEVTYEMTHLKEELLQSQQQLEHLNEELMKKSEELTNRRAEEESKISILEKQLNQMKMVILDREVELEASKKMSEDKDKIIHNLKDTSRLLEDRLKIKEKELHDQKNKFTQENRLLKKEVDKLKQDMQKLEDNLRASFESDKTTSLRKLREEMAKNHKSEMDLMKSRFKLASNVEKAQDPLETSIDYGTLMAENSSLQEEIKQLKKVHEEELVKIRQEYEEAIQAAKKVSLSESVSRVQRDKDVVIKELKSEIVKLKDQVESLENPRCLSPLDSPAYQALDPSAKLSRLESIIKEKDNRIIRLQDNLSQASEKAAILSCVPGDLVLFFFEKKYNAYVMFTLNPLLHLLSSDSVDIISQQKGHGDGDNLWRLAIAEEKQLCQARKAKNRYNLEIGTKFYIIKARPWTKPEELKKSKGKQMTSSVSVTSDLRKLSTDDKSETRSDVQPIKESLSTSCFPNLT